MDLNIQNLNHKTNREIESEEIKNEILEMKKLNYFFLEEAKEKFVKNKIELFNNLNIFNEFNFDNIDKKKYLTFEFLIIYISTDENNQEDIKLNYQKINEKLTNLGNKYKLYFKYVINNNQIIDDLNNFPEILNPFNIYTLISFIHGYKSDWKYNYLYILGNNNFYKEYLLHSQLKNKNICDIINENNEEKLKDIFNKEINFEEKIELFNKENLNQIKTKYLAKEENIELFCEIFEKLNKEGIKLNEKEIQIMDFIKKTIDLNKEHEIIEKKKEEKEREEKLKEQNKINLFSNISKNIIIGNKNNNENNKKDIRENEKEDNKIIEKEENKDENKIIEKEENKEDSKIIQKEENKEDNKIIEKEEKKEDIKIIEKEEKKQDIKVIEKEEKKDDIKIIEKEKNKDENKIIEKEENKEDSKIIQKEENKENNNNIKVENNNSENEKTKNDKNNINYDNNLNEEINNNKINKKENNDNSKTKPEIKKNKKINLTFSLNFNNRNVIENIPKNAKLCFNTSFSSSFYGKCHSLEIKEKKENHKLKIPNFSSPSITHNHYKTNLKISNNVYLIDNKIYNIPIYDYYIEKSLIGNFKCEIPFKQYNLNYLLENILIKNAICEYCLRHFNLLMFKKNINIKLNSNDLYEITFYNSKYLFGEELIELYKSKYDKKIIETFSHFSYCLSYGSILIDNIIEYDGKIHLFNLFKVDSVDYIYFIKFFKEHQCNEYCEELSLKNENFFNIISQENINLITCELCKNIFSKGNDDNNNEIQLKNLCNECKEKTIKSKNKLNCISCNTLFEYYHYYYINKKIELPNLCDRCIKLNPKQ